RLVEAVRADSGLVPPQSQFPSLQPSFFFAASGTLTFVVPTSLISVVVARSTSTSFPLKSTLPFTLNSYLDRTPSFTQNFTEPFGLLTLPNRNCAFAPSS